MQGAKPICQYCKKGAIIAIRADQFIHFVFILFHFKFRERYISPLLKMQDAELGFCLFGQGMQNCMKISVVFSMATEKNILVTTEQNN